MQKRACQRAGISAQEKDCSLLERSVAVVEKKDCLTRPAVEFGKGAEEARLESERKLAQVIKRLRRMGLATDAILDAVPMPKEFVMDVLGGKIYRAVRAWDMSEDTLRAELRRMRAEGFSEAYLEMYEKGYMKGVWEVRESSALSLLTYISKLNVQPSQQDIHKIAEVFHLSVERVLEIAEKNGIALPAWE